MPYQAKYVVLGAGISGLATAWALQKQLGPAAVIVLEKEKYPGGWIKSWQNEEFFFEQGPRSLRISEESRSTLELIEELNLTSQIVTDAPTARYRYLWNGQRLQQVPNKFWRFFTSPLTRDLVFTLAKEWFHPLDYSEDESIYDFITRRYSSKMAQRLIDPLIAGIYAGDIHKLSARACLPKLWQWEKEQGSILKGMLFSPRSPNPLPLAKHLNGHTLFTLQDGLCTLPQAIARRIHNLRLNTEVIRLHPNNQGTLITLADGSTIQAKHVMSTLPAHALVPLLTESIPSLAQCLNSFFSTSIVAVHLGWRQNLLATSGFGYLIPSCLDENTLGTVFDSSAFPSQNKKSQQTRLTVMLGGEKKPHLARACQDTCLDVAKNAVRRHLGIDILPDIASVTYAQQAIPQYTVGHCIAVEKLRSTCAALCPSLSLLGSSFDGVAVTTCISHSMAEIKKFLSNL